MKFKRSQLKAIIKECLVEILQEGIGNSLATSTSFAVPGVQTQQYVEARRSTPTTQRPVRAPVAPPRALSPHAQIVQEVASHNSVLGAIMADTLATTMPEQDSMSDPREQASLYMSDNSSLSSIEDGTSHWSEILDRV